LWTFAFVCDLTHAFGSTALWSTVALYCVAGGVVGAVVAAVPGLIDYFFIDEADMKRIATMHLLVNLGAVVIFAVNLWARFRVSSESDISLILSGNRNGGGRLRRVVRWRDGLREGYGG